MKAKYCRHGGGRWSICDPIFNFLYDNICDKSRLNERSQVPSAPAMTEDEENLEIMRHMKGGQPHPIDPNRPGQPPPYTPFIGETAGRAMPPSQF